jgi:UDP-N-acetylmuramate--alanine ligase
MNSIGTIQSSTFIDDYAHHPLEIEKLISVIRLFTQQNKFLIIEPHRYSRLNSLYNDYLRVLSDFGNVIILDTYTAGESLKKNWKNSKDLVNDLNTVKSKKALYINDYQDLFEFLDNMMKKSKNNLFVFAGAGSISSELKTYYARRI